MDELSNRGSRVRGQGRAAQLLPTQPRQCKRRKEDPGSSFLDEIAELRRQLNAKDALDPLRKAHESG